MRFSYSTINNIGGFLVFIVASAVYCLTVEPTASFWDCGEFILSAYKLEVGHPPGAPFFMLTANLFTQFTNDPELVARMVNYMSALMSGATILFLFFTITHLVKKLLIHTGEIVIREKTIIIIGCGAVGALTYAFSDTFWFSAVEGEVYAYSSLFTALVFWLILKWEASDSYSDRWLILIAYLTGLSIGVHLLNLLCLPAIVLVYYYKNTSHFTVWGTIKALLLSMVLIAVVLYGIVPGVMKMGGWFELLFVNKFGFSFNTGFIVYVISVFILIIWGIGETFVGKNKTRMKISFVLSIVMTGIPFYGEGLGGLFTGIVVISLFFIFLFRKKILSRYKPSIYRMHTILLCLLMILVGYSSYGVILIRSAANTPMDQNSPQDVFTLSYYLGRGQYGETPLLYGQAYSSQPVRKVEGAYCVTEIIEGAPNYVRKPKEVEGEKDEYINVGNTKKIKYAQNMLFPRMYSDQHANYGNSGANLYANWVDIKGKNTLYDCCGDMLTVTMPTQWENLKFFLSYQLNFMYWRYFLWNFVGRQNDIQGFGEIEHGNWITGIPFVDEWIIGNEKEIPDNLKNNKGRNVYYGIPLLLGLLGIWWQLRWEALGKQSFLIVFFLFFMTGVAIILYLNQTPMQARERDYAYAGSFYAFAIWIGMGVAGLASILQKTIKKRLSVCLTPILCMYVPIQMAFQNWDDHDRSGRYSARDFGRNYLLSASSGVNPIICTNGDNDTFPLWYNLEVEEFHTDARVCNLSYLTAAWYIDQMKRPYYDSPALPISWEHQEYMTGTREYVYIYPEMKEQLDAYYAVDPERAAKEFGENPYELKNILRYWVRSPNERNHIIPTDSIVIELDKEAIRKSGMKIPEALNGEIPDYMEISLKNKRALTKSELMLLEIISGCNWERPVFVAITVPSEYYLDFKKNLSQEGFLYRITPFNMEEIGEDKMDIDKTFDYLMNEFRWGGMEKSGIYFDETTLNLYTTSRRMFASLAEKLIQNGDRERALKVLERASQAIPPDHFPYNEQNGALTFAECYYEMGMNEQGDEILNLLSNRAIQYINWYLGMNKNKWRRVKDNCMYHLYFLNEEVKMMEQFNSSLKDEYADRFETLYERYFFKYKG